VAALRAAETAVTAEEKEGTAAAEKILLFENETTKK
jgi:hypothetical protein